MTLKDRVGRGKTVQFLFYTDGALWYTTEDGFKFPVPITEVGNATFMAQDKAILFMRYIRKHMDHLQELRTTAAVL